MPGPTLFSRDKGHSFVGFAEGFDEANQSSDPAEKWFATITRQTRL